nr:TSC22 domain family protein 4 [Loxodonta africana]
MSGGKKKSSFQITSVTTDYEGPGSPGGADSPTPPAPTRPPLRLPNGEPNPEPGGKGTPRNGSPPPGAPASRFRVVKLPQGLGEPYRRGRWTCVDVYDRDLEPPNFGRLLEGIRGASGGTGGRSLDSRLEVASLGLGTPTPQPGLSQGPTSWLRPPPTSPGPQARSLTRGLGQMAVTGKAMVETSPLSASPPQQRPPEPGTRDSEGTSRAPTPLPSLRMEVEPRNSAAGTPPLSRRNDGALQLRMELVAPEETGQVPQLDSHPSSPALYFFPDSSLVHKSPDPFGAAAAQSLSLARSMLAISGHLDSDDDRLLSHGPSPELGHQLTSLSCPPPLHSGTGARPPEPLTSLDLDLASGPLFLPLSPDYLCSCVRALLTFSCVAWSQVYPSSLRNRKSLTHRPGRHWAGDEVGMAWSPTLCLSLGPQDLVKSHLMFAVREEVEVLKEQIRELAERNAALEQENGLLRALASPEQLAQLPSSGVPRLGPPAPNGPSV